MALSRGLLEMSSQEIDMNTSSAARLMIVKYLHMAMFRF